MSIPGGLTDAQILDRLTDAGWSVAITQAIDVYTAVASKQGTTHQGTGTLSTALNGAIALVNDDLTAQRNAREAEYLALDAAVDALEAPP
jgi:hypothetical protein